MHYKDTEKMFRNTLGNELTTSCLYETIANFLRKCHEYFKETTFKSTAWRGVYTTVFHAMKIKDPTYVTKGASQLTHSVQTSTKYYQPTAGNDDSARDHEDLYTLIWDT